MRSAVIAVTETLSRDGAHQFPPYVPEMRILFMRKSAEQT